MRSIPDKTSLEMPPQPPQEPDEFACCQSECGENCVWEIYRQAKLRYASELAAWQARQA